MTRRPLVVGGLVMAVLTLVDAPPPLRLTPVLRLRKTVSLDGACPGVDRISVRAATSVTYCYTVTNTGFTPARDIVVTDAGRSVRVGALAGGQSRTVTRTVVVTSGADPDAAPDATATLAAADATATELAPFSSQTASDDSACSGIEVATVLSGTAVTACYTIAKSDEPALDATALDGQAGAPVASLPPAAGAVRGAFFPLGATSATATTLQSP